MPVGLRVYTNVQRPPSELVSALGELPTSNIADCMNRFFTMDPMIRLFGPMSSKLVGSAVTVRTREGDNLMIQQALDLAKPGDVIVVASGGGRRSLVGEIMCQFAKKKGIAGMVLDGPIRDVEAIYNMGFPVYATGSNPGGPHKEGPGEINVTVSCGGVEVHPGDIIVGDADGVVVIPPADAAEVLQRSRKLFENEQAKLRAIAEGTADRSWVAKLIREKGVEVID
jgi:RraA family protein